MSAKKAPRKQYGRRASGKTQTTISLSDELLAKAKENAEADGRSLSNYIEQLLKKEQSDSSDPTPRR
jgi:predicted DNA binding CopG/RHH family protein